MKQSHESDAGSRRLPSSGSRPVLHVLLEGVGEARQGGAVQVAMVSDLGERQKRDAAILRPILRWAPEPNGCS